MISNENPLISALVSDPDMQPLLVEYADDLLTEERQLEEQLRLEDAPGLKQTIHRLKGSGGGYGYPEISRLAGEIHNAFHLELKVTEDIESKVRALILLCQRARAGIALLKRS